VRPAHYFPRVTTSVVNSPAIDAVRAAVKEQGLGPVATLLAVNRNTLASVLSGAGRAESVARIESRVDRLFPATSPEIAIHAMHLAAQSHPELVPGALAYWRKATGDADLGRPIVVPDVFSDIVKRRGLDWVAGAACIQAVHVAAVIDGSAPVHILRLAAACLHRLREADRSTPAPEGP